MFHTTHVHNEHLPIRISESLHDGLDGLRAIAQRCKGAASAIPALALRMLEASGEAPMDHVDPWSDQKVLY